MPKIMVTGGAGFIGSAVVSRLVAEGHEPVVLDALTYSGRKENLDGLMDRITFVEGSIADTGTVSNLFRDNDFAAVINVAAESHVDRSIDGPKAFLETNVNGVFVLLEAALAYWRTLPKDTADRFRFLQVSTDEVFGSIPTGAAAESAAYRPNSPYSATKASADMLVRSYNKTYGLPVVTTHGSNTYGARQFPEKLLPLMILRALSGMSLPVYGDGTNVREWLHVDDHVEGILAALRTGEPGEAYNIGSGFGHRNIDVVRQLCGALNDIVAGAPDFEALIEFVTDRPGHDLRYALDISKAQNELGWSPKIPFDRGLSDTIDWYVGNRSWWEPLTGQDYSLSRLGTISEPENA